MTETRQEPLPEHVTTPLLTLITQRSLDEDYAHVAARRAEQGEARPPTRLRWTSVAAVGVLGIMTAVVAVQTRRDAEVDELSRAALITQIEARQARVAEMRDQARTLADDNEVLLDRLATLDEQQRDLEATQTRTAARAGLGAVQGEGVRFTVDNAPGVEVDSEIRDEDLAILVNALWEVGAEAIAIDDERLTVLSGIRNTGRAVHVNGNPVDAPYVVSAIGDKDTMQAELLASSQGQEWFALVNGLHFRYQAQNVDELQLPAATWRPLRQAVAVTANEDAATPKTEEPSP